MPKAMNKAKCSLLKAMNKLKWSLINEAHPLN